MDHFKDKAASAAAHVGENVAAVSEDIQYRAKDAWNTVSDQTRHALYEGKFYIRRHPVPATLVVLGFGVILGLFLNRQSTEPLKELPVKKSLHQSRSVLLGLVIAFGALIKRTFSSASDAAETVGDDFNDSVKSLKKTVRHTVKKPAL